MFSKNSQFRSRSFSGDNLFSDYSESESLVFSSFDGASEDSTSRANTPIFSPGTPLSIQPLTSLGSYSSLIEIDDSESKEFMDENFNISEVSSRTPISILGLDIYIVQGKVFQILPSGQRIELKEYKIEEKTEGANDGFVITNNGRPVVFAKIATDFDCEDNKSYVKDLAEADYISFKILRDLGLTVPQSEVGTINYKTRQYQIFYSAALENYQDLRHVDIISDTPVTLKFAEESIKRGENAYNLNKLIKQNFLYMEKKQKRHRDLLSENICRFMIVSYLMGIRDLNSENIGISDFRSISIIDADMVNIYKALDIQQQNNCLKFESFAPQEQKLSDIIDEVSPLYPYMPQQRTKKSILGYLLAYENITEQNFDDETVIKRGSLPHSILKTFLKIDDSIFNKTFYTIKKELCTLADKRSLLARNEQKILQLIANRCAVLEDVFSREVGTECSYNIAPIKPERDKKSWQQKRQEERDLKNTLTSEIY